MGVSRGRNSVWVLWGGFVSMHVVPRYRQMERSLFSVEQMEMYVLLSRAEEMIGGGSTTGTKAAGVGGFFGATVGESESVPTLLQNLKHRHRVLDQQLPLAQRILALTRQAMTSLERTDFAGSPWLLEAEGRRITAKTHKKRKLRLDRVSGVSEFGDEGLNRDGSPRNLGVGSPRNSGHDFHTGVSSALLAAVGDNQTSRLATANIEREHPSLFDDNPPLAMSEAAERSLSKLQEIMKKIRDLCDEASVLDLEQSGNWLGFVFLDVGAKKIIGANLSELEADNRWDELRGVATRFAWDRDRSLDDRDRERDRDRLDEEALMPEG